MKIKRKKNDSEMVVFSFLPLMKGEVRWGLDSRTTLPCPSLYKGGKPTPKIVIRDEKRALSQRKVPIESAKKLTCCHSS